MELLDQTMEESIYSYIDFDAGNSTDDPGRFGNDDPENSGTVLKDDTRFIAVLLMNRHRSQIDDAKPTIWELTPKKHVLAGLSLDGLRPAFLGRDASNSSPSLDNVLGSECGFNVFGAGRGQWRPRFLPHVLMFRPGQLSLAKRYVDDANKDVYEVIPDKYLEGMASRFQHQLTESGPWTAPLELMTEMKYVENPRLGAIQWSLRTDYRKDYISDPYAKIPAFSRPTWDWKECDRITKLIHRQCTHDYFSKDQLLIICMWWAEFRKAGRDYTERFANNPTFSHMHLPLGHWIVLLPLVLADCETFGVAVYPHFGRAISIMSSSLTKTMSRRNSEPQYYIPNLEGIPEEWYGFYCAARESNEVKIIGGVTPADMRGSDLAPFPESDLVAARFSRPTYPGVTRDQALEFTRDCIGHISTLTLKKPFAKAPPDMGEAMCLIIPRREWDKDRHRLEVVGEYVNFPKHKVQVRLLTQIRTEEPFFPYSWRHKYLQNPDSGAGTNSRDKDHLWLRIPNLNANWVTSALRIPARWNDEHDNSGPVEVSFSRHEKPVKVIWKENFRLVSLDTKERTKFTREIQNGIMHQQQEFYNSRGLFSEGRYDVEEAGTRRNEIVDQQELNKYLNNQISFWREREGESSKKVARQSQLISKLYAQNEENRKLIHEHETQIESNQMEE